MIRDAMRSWLGALFALPLALIPAGARATLPQAASEAAAWLELVQNPDGSWGESLDIQPVLTSEAVVALRAYGRLGRAYYAGVAWLENRAMTNTDTRARRIVALRAHGDDVSADQSRLDANFSLDGFHGDGWGLVAENGPSALDTGLALWAYGALGMPAALQAHAVSGASFLINTAVAGGGWKAALATANTVADPVTTAIVLRGYAAVRSGISGLDGSGNAAQSFLLTTVTTGSAPLQKAQAALAVLRWSPGTTSADTWLNNLDTTQAANGSWAQDVYATAVALHALSARLGTDAATLQQNIAIQDLALRAAINLALGKNRADAITRRDMQSLTRLDASGFGIHNLTGIQEAINLTWIDLVGNTISDLSPLNAIPGLATVVLAGLCDLDDDGVISARDAQRVLRAAAQQLTLTANEQAAADVIPIGSPDGAVNVRDATAVLRAAAGWPVPACQN